MLTLCQHKTHETFPVFFCIVLDIKVLAERVHDYGEKPLEERSVECVSTHAAEMPE